MEPAHRFDEVYSVSDLHFGGQTGRQIFDLGETLAKFVDQLRSRPKGRRVALVINGDFVDFLAEDPAVYFDPDRAVQKLERIIADAAFSPVWKALQRYTRSLDRHLIVTLGNHDLELALPWVSERLLDELSAGQPAARGRILLSFDGSGFLCGVGSKRILFVHGNEVDTWNLCDHESLRRIGRDLTQGNKVDPWTPNAGTKMVIDVMNSIKQRYPFIDLLKPEGEAAVPMLLAIDPKQTSKLRDVLPSVGRRIVDGVRRLTGFLSADEAESGKAARAADLRLQGIVQAKLFVSATGADVEEMLDRVEGRMARGEDAYQALDRDRNEEYLSVVGAVWKKLRGAKKEDVVREAFKGLKEDQSFELADEDQTFEDLDELIGPEIDFIVAGHTHLERKIPRRNGSGTYFNSGTWIRLMRLSDAILDDSKTFGEVLRVLEEGSLESLDRFTYREGGAFKPLVIRKPAVVSFVQEGEGVKAGLYRVDLKSGRPLQPEADLEGGS